MKAILLYSTAGCHLCEQAQALMEPVLSAADYALEVVDIAESDHLLSLYQLSIPVAKNPATGEELLWPFDAEQVRSLVA